MPLVEKRYAHALAGVSGKAANVFLKEFSVIKDLYNNDQDFKLFILSPEIHPDIKKDVIKNIFKGKVRDELVNFMLLLIDKGRGK